RDSRREPVDGVDVRLLHQLQELPCIRRQRLDVAALALGIDRVEGERRLAGTREPRDHHEAVAGHLDVDVLQVVLASTANDDPVLHFRGLITWGTGGGYYRRRAEKRLGNGALGR